MFRILALLLLFSVSAEAAYIPPTGSDASGANVKATGGTTARTLADRAADAINIKDGYGGVAGAKGDGTTDDTSAINAALAYAASVGKAARAPGGVYRITNITYPSTLTKFFGDGAGATVLKRVDNDTTGRYMINASSAAADVEDMTIDGNTAANTFFSVGIFDGSNQITVKGVESMNHRSNGAGGVGGNYGIGIWFVSNATLSTAPQSIVSGNYLHGNAGCGFASQGTTYHLTIANNRSNRNACGISVTPSGAQTTGDVQYVDIVGNQTSYNTGGGISLAGFNNLVSYPVQHVNVTGNVTSHNGSYGLVMQCDQCSFTGNVVDANGSSTNIGGGLANGTNNTISGNSFTNNQGWGIDAGGAQHLTITDNYFRNNLFAAGNGTAIDLNGNLGSTVSGNTFDHNGGTNGSEISVTSYDGGGIWPAFASLGKQNVIANNTFLLSANTWGILTQGGITGIVIRNNSFTRDGATSPDYLMIGAGGVSGSVSGNISTDYPAGGTVVTAGATLLVPDWSDTVFITGSGASISKIWGYTQQTASGKVTYITPGSSGTCTVSPTVTITGDGSGATASILLNGPVPAGVGAYTISASGTGYTSATASLSGGTCTVQPVPGAVQIGYPTAYDGRKFTLVNASGVTQTLVNGALIALAGGANVTLTNNSSISFRVASSGVWYETSRSLQ